MRSSLARSKPGCRTGQERGSLGGWRIPVAGDLIPVFQTPVRQSNSGQGAAGRTGRTNRWGQPQGLDRQPDEQAGFALPPLALGSLDDQQADERTGELSRMDAHERRFSVQSSGNGIDPLPLNTLIAAPPRSDQLFEPDLQEPSSSIGWAELGCDLIGRNSLSGCRSRRWQIFTERLAAVLWPDSHFPLNQRRRALGWWHWQTRSPAFWWFPIPAAWGRALIGLDWLLGE